MATPMPTGAKLMGALSFAVVGWLIANAYVPNMPEVEAVGLLREMVAGIGAIIGWKVMGNSVGKGYVAAIGSGWKTVIVLVFFSLLMFGLYEMLLDSVKMRYDGPGEAIIDVFQKMGRRSQALLSWACLGFAVVGGGIAGMLTENASRRWT